MRDPNRYGFTQQQLKDEFGINPDGSIDDLCLMRQWTSGVCTPARTMITGRMPSPRSRNGSTKSVYITVGESRNQPRHQYIQAQPQAMPTVQDVRAAATTAVRNELQSKTQARVVDMQHNRRVIGRDYVEVRFDRPHGFMPHEINRLFGFDADVNSTTTVKVY